MFSTRYEVSYKYYIFIKLIRHWKFIEVYRYQNVDKRKSSRLLLCKNCTYLKEEDWIIVLTYFAVYFHLIFYSVANGIINNQTNVLYIFVTTRNFQVSKIIIQYRQLNTFVWARDYLDYNNDAMITITDSKNEEHKHVVYHVSIFHVSCGKNFSWLYYHRVKYLMKKYKFKESNDSLLYHSPLIILFYLST